RTDDHALPGFEGASVHRAAWPESGELRAIAGEEPGADGTPSPLLVAAEVLGRIRKAKSDAKVSMRADVATIAVTDTADRLTALERAAGDVRDAGKVAAMTTAELDGNAEWQVEVVLAEVPPTDR
ncbi:MAG: hypothetical protein H0U29_04050, partial [Acidimicrobiia bacterium]|nr:hypothetical protein [Acidimicrobiia bacterium]